MKKIISIIFMIVLLTVCGISVFLFYIGFDSLYAKKMQGTQNPVPIEYKEKLKEEENKEISVSFVGDILLGVRIGPKIDKDGVNAPFSRVKEYLSATDLSIGNLECVISTRGKTIPGKAFSFRAKPEVIDGMIWSGLDILSTANNHILDYGRDALFDTFYYLDQKKMPYIGTGKNIEEAFKPIYFEKYDKKIAFIGATRNVAYANWASGKNTPGVASAYNEKKLIEEIKKADKQADYVITFMHWGKEKELIANSVQRNLARKMIDNGADVVVGSHPHVLQGYEYYKGKIIAYSLGNFVFTNNNKDTVIFNVKLKENKVTEASIIPCVIKDCYPQPVEEEDKKIEMYKNLENVSSGIKIVDGIIYEFHKAK